MDKKKLFTILIGLMLIGLMATSVLNFGIGGDGDRFKYRDYVFGRTQAGWVTYKDDKPIFLLYDPRDIEHLEANVNIDSLYSVSKIYLSVNPGDSINRAVQEFFRNIKFNVPIINACTVDVEVCADLPIKNLIH